MGRCKYVFQKGPYQGEKCYKCCDGDLCNEHFDRTVNLKPKVISNLKIKKSSSLEEQKMIIMMKIKKMENECSKYVRLYHGYALRINQKHEIPVRKKILLEIESDEFRDECRSEYDELDKKSQARYGFFEGFLEKSKEKYLSYPNTYVNVILFNGSIPEAEKRLEAVKIQYANCVKQISQLKKLVKKLDNKIIASSENNFHNKQLSNVVDC